jgi:hypothetical protein
MSNKIIWTLPFLTTLMSKKKLSEERVLNIKLSLTGFNDDENREYNVDIIFLTTLCYLHNCNSFLPEIYENSYENIIVLEDSLWLKKIEQKNKQEYLFWKLKHYAIYFHDDGMYEFLARNVEVFVDGKKVELS